ncbi:MAG: DNA primase [Clostridia bacterium]|nr:DNA primase [Clostridia bacterium]
MKARCDIETLISSYVNLKHTGSNLKGLCPFHSEKTPSFTVYPGTQSFYCFGCGAAGDAVTFMMKAENLDYMAALERLAQRAGINLSEYESDHQPKKTGVTRTRVLEMNLEAAKFFRDQLNDEKTGEKARAYFFGKRKLSTHIVRRFGLGYDPDAGDSLVRRLTELGFTKEEIVKGFFGREYNGRQRDYFRGRVMFPIIDTAGQVIAFGGRVLDDSKPKYLNTSDTPAFKKLKNLFALNYAKNTKAGFMILCEGYMDVISLHDAGFEMAVATLGTAINDEQARLLSKYTKKVILSYDSDEPGQRATERAIDILEKTGIEVRVLRLTGAKDPDEFIKRYGADAFRKVLENSLGKFEYRIEMLKGAYDFTIPEQKIRAVDEVTSFIADVTSRVEREIYIRQSAEIFGLQAKSIEDDVLRKRRISDSRRKREQREKLIVETAGLNDRVNPDFASDPAAARAEQSALGLIFLRNEYITRKVDGKALGSEDFTTAFGARLFRFISDNSRDGGFDMAQLNGEFSETEVARAFRMLAERSELENNGEEAFDGCVRAMREIRDRNAAEGSLESILDLRRKNSK